MGALSQALDIIFEVQRKRSNEKITKKEEKSFQLTKRTVFLFSSLWTPPTFKPHNFLIYYSFKTI